MPFQKPRLTRQLPYLDNDDIILGEGDILERLDEYSLYCHYLEYEPQFGVKYTSPLRGEEAKDFDDRPSFGIFISKRRKDVEYMWKDQGKGIHGDIFDLVRRLYRLPTRILAIVKVRGDFGMGPGMDCTKVKLFKPQVSPSFKIRVSSRAFRPEHLSYWIRYNITVPILNYYLVTNIGMYWTFLEQESPKFPRSAGYAYRIWDRYQLYFPYENPDFKFRNDFDERHLLGFCQLRFNSDLLVITKALKDVMMFRSFGIEAVAPRGEHTMIPENFMELFKQRYKYIVVIMDNDGKHKADEYVTSYGCFKTEIPLSTNTKDPTDHCAQYGYRVTEELLLNLIYDQIGTRSFIRSYVPG
jgi:hypothetical protein